MNAQPVLAALAENFYFWLILKRVQSHSEKLEDAPILDQKQTTVRNLPL